MDNTEKIVNELIKSNNKKLLYLWIRKNNIKEIIKIIEEYTNGEKYNMTEIIEQFEIAYSKTADVIKANQETRGLLNKPKCPTCNSTNVQKIGGLERAGSVYMFGAFSNKINKSFKCKNCGYTW